MDANFTNVVKNILKLYRNAIIACVLIDYQIYCRLFDFRINSVLKYLITHEYIITMYIFINIIYQMFKNVYILPGMIDPDRLIQTI